MPLPSEEDARRSWHAGEPPGGWSSYEDSEPGGAHSPGGWSSPEDAERAPARAPSDRGPGARRPLGADASARSLGGVSAASRSSARSSGTEATSAATNRWGRDALASRSSKLLEGENRRLRREAEEELERRRRSKKRGGILGAALAGLSLGARGGASDAPSRSDATSDAPSRSLGGGPSSDSLLPPDSLALEDPPGAAPGSAASARRAGISRAGPHPTARKALAGLPASAPIESVPKRALVLTPSRGQKLREGADELLSVLEEYAGFEILERERASFGGSESESESVSASSSGVSASSRAVEDSPSPLSLASRLAAFVAAESCGVVVNGLDAVDPALWRAYRDIRRMGVLVMNYDHPGLFLAHDAHVAAPASVPKSLPPYSVDLEARCETRDDGYREVTIHVVSGPDMEAERLLLRTRVLPMLTERCRTRRVRPVYVDLRDDAAGCGPGLAMRTAEAARAGAVHVLLVSGKLEPEVRGNERLRTFVERIPRGGGEEKFEWLRDAPCEDYSRVEYVAAQILRLADEPAWAREKNGPGGKRARRRKDPDSDGDGGSGGAGTSDAGTSEAASGTDAGGGAGARRSLRDGASSAPSAASSSAPSARSSSRSLFGSFFGGSTRTKSSLSLAASTTDGTDATERTAASEEEESAQASALSFSTEEGEARRSRENARAALEAAEARATADASNLAAALKRASRHSEQHVLAYVRDADFASRVPPEDLSEFYATADSAYERERVGSLLSALYAHPNVAVRPYAADYAPPTDPGGGGFVSGVPSHASDLQDFVQDVLEDVWSRVDREFPARPALDLHAWHEREPEFTLQRSLPFYFSRSKQEHTIVRCVKLGRPSVIVVAGRPGAGVTSLLQRCARECRRLYGNFDGASRDEVVTLSAFPGVGGAEGTPTQTLRRLATALKTHRGLPHDVPGSLNGARRAFLAMLRATITIHRRVAIFVDAATALENPRGLAWLPSEAELPAGAQIVVGARAPDEKLAQALAADRSAMLSPEGVLTHAPEKLLKAQLAALGACAPAACEQILQLRPMQFLERKLYVVKHLKLAGVELDESVLTEVLNKPGVSSVPYARMFVETVCGVDLDTFDLVKHVDDFPASHDAMLQSRLDELEMIFPRSTLALILPTVALARGSLTMEDIMAVVVTTLEEDEEPYLDSVIAPALMWEARHFVQGPFDGTYRVAGDVAARAVLERYVPDERSRRAAYRMLAEYFGDLDEDADDDASVYSARDRDGNVHKYAPSEATTPSPKLRLDLDADEDESDVERESVDRTRRRPSPGKGLLARMHHLSPRALDRDGDGRLIDPEAFQDHHLVVDALHHLPFFLTRARRFGELVALLRDFSFLQAKLELGEGAALLEDFDRILRVPRAPWLEEWDGGDGARVGSAEYLRAKKTAEKALSSKCLGYDAEAFQRWMGDAWGLPESAHGDIVAFRDVIARNLEYLHVRPHALLQTAMNAPGDAEPGAAAEDSIRRLCPPPRGPNARTPGAYAFADADAGEEFLLLWGNRPEEAPCAEILDRDVHAERVASCAWTESCAGFVTASEDGVCAMWSAHTGEAAARFAGHAHAITACAFADVKERGGRVFTASRDRTIRCAKIAGGDMGRTTQTLAGHVDHVVALAYAEATGELLSAGLDGRIVVWDATSPTPRRVHTVKSSHANGAITCVAVSRDGRVFATGGADATTHAWSMTPVTAKRAAAVARRRAQFAAAADESLSRASEEEEASGPEMTLRLQGHLAEVTCCAFGASASHLATGGADHSVMLWNPSAGAHVGALVGHDAPVTDVSYSRDGRVLVSASMDNRVRLWRARTGETIAVLDQGAASRGATCARLSPDASRLLVGRGDGSVAVWGWVGREGSASAGQSPQTPGLFERGHELRREAIADGEEEEEESAETWAANPFAFEGQAHKGAVTSVAAFTLPPALVAEESEGDSDSDDESSERRGSGGGSSGDGGSSGASPSQSSQSQRRRRRATRERKRRALERSSADLPALTGGADARVRKISARRSETGKVERTMSGHEGAVRAVAASLDGVSALSASDDGTVVLWDARAGLETLVMTGHEGPVLAACFGPGQQGGKDPREGPGGASSRALAMSGGKDRVVRVWDVSEDGGGAQVSSFDAHANVIRGLASSLAEPNAFASCGADRLARLWDLERTTRSGGARGGSLSREVSSGTSSSSSACLATFVGHSGGLTSVALASNRALAFTGSLDHTARAWDARCAAPSPGSGGAQVAKLPLAAVPVAVAACWTQPNWFAACAGDGLHVFDARTWREVAHFRALADVTCAAFHGTGRVFAGDDNGRLYALDVWKAPARSWV